MTTHDIITSNQIMQDYITECVELNKHRQYYNFETFTQKIQQDYNLTKKETNGNMDVIII